MKKVVFTCVTNSVDQLKDPPKTDEVEYICFTDDFFESRIWEIRPLLKKFDCPRLTARYHKTIGTNQIESDITIWQDGKISFIRPHEELFQKGIWFLKHPDRQCIYEEAVCVMQLRKDKPDVVKKQINRYRKECFPPDQGLYETSIVVRDKSASNLNEFWWKEIEKASVRDQISLPYVLWKNRIQPNIIDINYENNDLFKVNKHLFTDRIERIPLL